MSGVAVELLPGRARGRRRGFAAAGTDVAVSVLKAGRAAVRIVFPEIDATRSSARSARGFR